MSGLDPAATAAAYVQRLPADALAVAPAQTAWSETLLLASIAVALLAAFTVARSGVLEQIDRRMAAASRPRWMTDAASAAATAGLMGLSMVLLAPLSAAHGGGPAAVLAALVSTLRQAAVFSLLGALLAPPLYALMRRLPRLWAPLLGGLAAALVFTAQWLPFAQASGPASLPPAPAGPARTGLMQLIAEARLPATEVYVSANPAIDADVTGVGAARVVISRGLWRTASPEELRASVGHLMGHWAHHDQLWISLLATAMMLGLFLAVWRFTPPLAKLMGISAPSPAAAVAAPALIAVAMLWICLAGVAERGLVRWVNVGADQYSLDHARAPDGLAQALLHEWKGEAIDPSPVQEALFYDHPSLQSRLVHAMRWKAQHSG